MVKEFLLRTRRKKRPCVETVFRKPTPFQFLFLFFRFFPKVSLFLIRSIFFFFCCCPQFFFVLSVSSAAATPAGRMRQYTRWPERNDQTFVTLAPSLLYNGSIVLIQRSKILMQKHSNSCHNYVFQLLSHI